MWDDDELECESAGFGSAVSYFVGMAVAAIFACAMCALIAFCVVKAIF